MLVLVVNIYVIAGLERNAKIVAFYPSLSFAYDGMLSL